MAKVNKKIENIYSLTPLQEGMLFHNIYDSKSTAYIMQIVLDIRNNFRYEYFGQALALIAEKHQTLRSMFVYENVNSPKQVILKEREIESEFIDLTNNDEEKRIEEYNQILKDDKNRGFNLQKDSLIRIKTIKLGEKSFKVILTAHHIITDGWSNAVLIKELFDIYDKLVDGTDLQDIANIIREEKASSADYGDYILWHEKQDKQGALDYWDKVLEGYEGSCDIAPLAKGEQTDEQMLEKSIAIKSEITAKLRDIAKKNDVTINTVAETAVGMLLRSYTRNDDVVYGKVVSGRNAHINGIERMVGLFINTVPLRMKVEENETIDDLLVKIQKQGNESSLYDYCSLAEIQSKTIQGPDLIKVIFIFENYSSGMKSSDIAQETETVSLEYSREQTNYGISIICYDEGDLRFNIMFDPAKYSDKEIDLILERIEKICEEISEKHDLRINETETVTN
ncbi:condensation domain-containing protein, partial [Ruminococcus flavefaciens]|uniref:condensation domain-containing protein n=1 Tax=Ruminococcus flavefaciens TaxID=1265 RepID=UPI00056B33B9